MLIFAGVMRALRVGRGVGIKRLLRLRGLGQLDAYNYHIPIAGVQGSCPAVVRARAGEALNAERSCSDGNAKGYGLSGQ